MTQVSIRWKVTFWNTVAFAIVVICFSLLVYSLLRQTHFDQMDEQLAERMDQLLNDPEVERRPEQRLDFRFHKLGKHVEIKGIAFARDGKLVAAAEGLAAARPSGTELQKGVRKYETLQFGDGERYRRLITITQVGERPLEIQLFAELEHLDEELTLVAHSLLVTVVITLVVAALVAYLLAIKTLAPVHALTRMTDEITAENLDLRLPVPNPSDELGHLATTINSMISRLQSSFEQVKRFTADASHELRTPIAVIRSEAELGIDQTVESSSRERFQSILEESSRFATITSQLLELSRHDAAVRSTVLKPTSVRVLVEQTVSSLRSIAEERDQQLVFDSFAKNAIAIGDDEQLLRIFHNLIENAIKYSRPGDVTRIGCFVSDGFVVVEIIDSGIGIPEDAVPRVFDRFYRVTKENSSVESGAGLGLSIVKSIVEMHNGRIEVESQLGRGSTFRVFLPAAN